MFTHAHVHLRGPSWALGNGGPHQPQGEGARAGRGVGHRGLQRFTLCTVLGFGVWLRQSQPLTTRGLPAAPRSISAARVTPRGPALQKTIFWEPARPWRESGVLLVGMPRRGSHKHTSAPWRDGPAEAAPGSGPVQGRDGRPDPGMPTSNQGGGVTGVTPALWVCVRFPDCRH